MLVGGPVFKLLVRPRVLVVDDNPLVLKALRRFLGSRYAIWSAQSVDESLKIVAGTEVDVVVTDLDLGDPKRRDGFWLLRHLERRWRIRGLVLSGGHEEHDRYPVLRKPVGTAVLLNAIDALLATPETGPEAGRSG